MTAQWWYYQDENKGPFTLEELKGLLREGKVSAQTYVWTASMANWQPLGDVPALQAAPPPPVPVLQKYVQNSALPSAGSWRRFFARITDLLIIGMPLGAALAYGLASWSLDFAIWMQKPGASYIFGWLAFPLVLVVESLLYEFFGNSLGKYLFNVNVVDMMGRPLTFTAHLQRQVGVYWAGMGTGFPLLQLVPMVWQARRLNKGLSASYDTDKYQVKAGKMSVGRTLISAVIVFVLFAIFSILNSINRSHEKAYYEGSSWTNPVTANRAQLPAGWTNQNTANSDGQSIYVFMNPESNTVVVFGKEDYGDHFSLEQYAELFAQAVKADLELLVPGQPTVVGSRSGWILTGTKTEDKTKRGKVTFAKRGNQIWRVVVVTSNGDEGFAQTEKLQSQLFGTLG